MNDPRVPEAFAVDSSTADVLQELQVALGVEDHYTEGLALEAAILWYDETVESGNALRFHPPSEQPAWQTYTRTLEIDPGSDAEGRAAQGGVRVEGRARRRLEESEMLLGLTTQQGIARIVRLRAEHAFRLADGWTIEVEHEEGAEQ